MKLSIEQGFDVTPDPQGGLWLLDPHEKLLHYGTALNPISMLPKGTISTNLVADNDSALIPSQIGLLRWNGKAWSSLASANGLPCSNVLDVLIAPNYGWWLSLSCGAAFLPKDQVEKWKLLPDAKLRVISFDSLDGARPSPTPFRPPSAVTPDGREWFVSHAGLQMIDLVHMPANNQPPPVHITNLVADNKALGISANLNLPPLSRSIRIEYNGLSYVRPQKVVFKYRLSGIDTDWQDVGARREAFYMNLPPGKYSFQVIARNSDDVWNTIGDSLQFTLPPTFYQTRWFLVLEIGSALLVLFLIFRIRLTRATELLNAQHRERLAERDRIARDLHDTLLQGFHGLMIRLHTGVKMIPPAEAAKAVLNDVINRADLVIIEGRNSVRNLREHLRERSKLSIELERATAELRIGDTPSFVSTIFGTECELDSDAHDEILSVGR